MFHFHDAASGASLTAGDDADLDAMKENYKTKVSSTLGLNKFNNMKCHISKLSQSHYTQDLYLMFSLVSV